MKVDFKYILVLIISIVGVSLTIWYANKPPSIKSLSLKIDSKSLINAVGEQDIPGLKIFIDKNEIENPALTVLTIKNNGSIPIRSADFESDIEIILEENTQLIRATVIKTHPEGLKVTARVNKSNAYISPLLLNPEESVTISLISQGLPNAVNTRSRIAGVSKIAIDEPKINHVISYFKLVLAFIVSIPFVALYSPTNPIPKTTIILNRRTWFMVVIILLAVAQFLTFTAIEDIFGFESFWKLMGSLFVVLLLALPLSLRLNQQRSGSKDINEKT